MGTGHVMRCLALAQAWQDAGGCAVFAMVESTPAVLELLRTEGFEVLPVLRGQEPMRIRGRLLLSHGHNVPNGWLWMGTTSGEISSVH